MRPISIIFGIIAAIIIIGGGITLLRKPSTESVYVAPGERKPVPDFTLLEMGGDAVSLKDHLGTPLVINSWASWCPFCIDELPDLVKIQKEFKNDIIVIAVNRSETLQRAREYTDENNITDDLIYLLDARDTFYKSIGGFSMPETLFVDRQGKIQFHKRGVMKIDEIRSRVNNLLKDS